MTDGTNDAESRLARIERLLESREREVAAGLAPRDAW